MIPDKGIIQRLLAKPVTARKNYVFPAVKKYKSPHAIEFLYAGRTPAIITGQDDLCIGTCCKKISPAFKFFFNLPVIIDLPVISDSSFHVLHRLISRTTAINN